MVSPSIGERLNNSASEVLQIGATERLASSPIVRSARFPFLLASAMLGLPPLLGCLAQTVTGECIGWFVWLTAAVYGLLIVCMLLGGRWAWRSLCELGTEIDAILGKDDHGPVTRWLDTALKTAPQLLVFLCGIACATWVAIELTDPLAGYLGDGRVAYVLTIGWTGGIGAITVYWLWSVPGLFYPLARAPEPQLDWVAPLQTPGIQQTSRLMRNSARLAALGLILFTIPIAVTVAVSSESEWVWAVSVSPLVFSIATSLVCGVLPQIALESLARRGKSRTLAEIRPLLPSPADAFSDPQPDRLELIAQYERLAGTPVILVDWRQRIERLLLFVSTVSPIAIALLTR